MDNKMNRQEFMSQLEKLLLYVPIQEREEALQYYNDYFDDAGEENEQEVIAALGNPARVAENIKKDLNQNLYGVEPDKVEPGKELVNYHPEIEAIEPPFQEPKKSIPNWVIVVIVICAFPILIGLISGAVGTVFGVIGAILGVVLGVVGIWFGLVVAFLAMGVALPFAGLAIMVAGVLVCVRNVLAGLGILGVGMLCIAGGIICIMVEVLLVGKVTPAIVKGIGKGIRKLTKKSV